MTQGETTEENFLGTKRLSLTRLKNGDTSVNPLCSLLLGWICLPLSIFPAEIEHICHPLFNIGNIS